MDSTYSFKIYATTADFPADWDAIAATNIFLRRDYLRVLEESAPENMRCNFIGLFAGEALCGVAISQFLSLNKIESFGERDSRMKTMIRHTFFNLFGANILILGNNMVTGQNAFVLGKDITMLDGIALLRLALAEIKHSLEKQKIKVCLTIFKDFYPSAKMHFKNVGFDDYFEFSTQPNMTMTFRPTWSSFDTYIGDITKKYRDQYKRARKKALALTKRQLSYEEIFSYNDRINQLYRTVAQNAPFNTFYLQPDHFLSLKKNLDSSFLFYAYFNCDVLVGFNTLIVNGGDIDTYFLGYDKQAQHDNMLYLNMLYDMTAYSINNNYRKIVFARTALEIKSSVGAVPEEMIGYMKHSNRVLNYFLPKLFRYFEPDMQWQQRHPFKEAELQVSSDSPAS